MKDIRRAMRKHYSAEEKPRTVCRHRRRGEDPLNDFAGQGYLIRITCDPCGTASARNTIELKRELHARRSSLRVEQQMKWSAFGTRRVVIRPSLGGS